MYIIGCKLCNSMLKWNGSTVHGRTNMCDIFISFSTLGFCAHMLLFEDGKYLADKEHVCFTDLITDIMLDRQICNRLKVKTGMEWRRDVLKYSTSGLFILPKHNYAYEVNETSLSLKHENWSQVSKVFSQNFINRDLLLRVFHGPDLHLKHLHSFPRCL